MYPHTHIYLTKLITGSSNELLLLGSVIPDLIQEGLMPQGFDRQVVELMRFFKEKEPKFIPLCLGMTLHEFPIGIDRFVHSSYNGGPGYAFQFNNELFSLAKSTFNCDDQKASLAAHFAVEKAVEIKVLSEHPDLLKELNKVMNLSVLSELFSLLAEFYNIPVENIEEEWASYKHICLDYDLSSVTDQAKEWSFLYKKVFSIDTPPDKIEKLIEAAKEVIKPSVDEFLDFCVSECKKDFDYNFGKLKSTLV